MQINTGSQQTQLVTHWLGDSVIEIFMSNFQGKLMIDSWGVPFEIALW